MGSRSSPSLAPSFRIPLAVLLGAVACWLTLAVTEPPGPGLDPDSMQYVAAARSLAARGTLEVPDVNWDSPDSAEPLSHFPPGVSAVLAVPTALGAPPVQSARALNSLAALAMMVIVFLIVSAAVAHEPGRGRLAGVAAAVMVGVTPAVAYVFMDVLSEPLFLALMAGTLAAMTARRARPLVAGIAAAAATMVRYAGVALVVAVVLWWIILPGTIQQRLRRAVTAAAPGVIALGAWMIRTHFITHGEGIREFSVYRQIGPSLREGARTLATWAVPVVTGGGRVVLALIVLAALTMLTVDAVRRWRHGGLGIDHGAPRLVAALILMAVTYVGVVVSARLFADPAIPLDNRLLAPLMFAAVLAVVTAAADGWPHWRRWERAAAGVLFGAWCLGSGWTTVQSGIYALETGNDYADLAWSGSPLIAWVRDHGTGRPLFTNHPTALYFHADRWSRVMPEVPRRDSARAFADTVASRHGLVVGFTMSTRFATSPTALLQLVPLSVRLVTRLPDGAIYELRR